MAEDKAKPSSGHEDTVPIEGGGLAAPTLADAAPPNQRYKLGAELGRGGMGRVVEALDTHLGRTVAVKEVLEGGGASLTRRFQREVRITARLEHASIVPLYDSGLMPDGRPFYVMRRVSGRPLVELIERARDLDERLALLPNVLAAIDAIAHAHRRGVIHRDLKPANILVGDLGETVVIDWGLAKVIDDDEPEPTSLEPHLPGDSLQTQAGAVFGTPGFMAPEQARGDELGPHSDVFALGATLYQLLAGKPPVRGSSATEVIASTVRLRIVPLRVTAPGAPAELVTVIEKALAPEPAGRYPNAGELAEDVRRFLTGQLVAAHRYTRRQRLVRFVRRHRAALSIAALAMTAVAVLSWFSVHRIVQERDIANTARGEAERQRVVAAAQANQARERADQLLVSHARTRLDASPLAAIAALQHIAHPQPPLADEITALAKAAVMRGVAWGLPTLPDLITSFEMTRDGKRLLELDRFGRLQLLDLDAHKSIAQREISGAFGATWVENDTKILMLRPKEQPPALFDPATNTVEDIATAMRTYAKTPDGKLLAYADTASVGVFDLATRTATQLWRGKPTATVAIASDGSWVAFGDSAKRWRVVDRSGRVLLDRPGDVASFAVSRTGKLAVLRFGELVETKPGDGKPLVVTVPVQPSDARFVHSISYHGDKLVMFSDRVMLMWDGARLYRGATFESSMLAGSETGSGAIAAVGNDNHVHVIRDDLHLTLPLTDRPPGMLRVAASPDSTRIAATAKGAILVWNIAGLFPQRLDVLSGVFVDPHTIVVTPGLASQMVFWDLQSNTRTAIDVRIDGLPNGWEVAEDGRVLIGILSDKAQALVVYPDRKRQIVVEGASTQLIGLVPGDALVYTLGKGRVFGRIGEEPARELVTLQGDVQSIAPNGPLGYAALSDTGEIVRGTFGGGDFARAHIKDLADDAFIVCDPERNVIVASGNRLLRWRGSTTEVARFLEKIASVTSTETGTYVTLANRDLYFLAAHGDQTPHRVPISQAFAIVDRGRRVIGLSAIMQIEIVDMPGFAKWTLPKLYTGRPALTASPDGQRVLHGYAGSSMLWALPTKLPALEQLTNATEEEDAIAWPWEP